MKKSIYILINVALLCTLILCGCSYFETPTRNVAPVLVRVLTDFAIPVGTSITLNVSHVDAYDDNGDAFKLVVRPGAHYSVSGTTVTPTKGYIGTLSVGLQVSDGSLLSNIMYGSITVEQKPSMMPLFTGVEWTYSDSTWSGDTPSVQSSHLVVTDVYSLSVKNVTDTIHSLKWLNADSLHLKFLFANSSTGIIEVGGISPTDSFLDPVLKLKYPVSPGQSWNYSSMEYNNSDKVFFRDTLVTRMRCTDTLDYVTVPAGIFKCVDYVYTRPATLGKLAKLSGGGFAVVNQNNTTPDSLKVTLKYAVGIGFIENISSIGTTVVAHKVLTSYTVNQ